MAKNPLLPRETWPVEEEEPSLISSAGPTFTCPSSSPCVPTAARRSDDMVRRSTASGSTECHRTRTRTVRVERTVTVRYGGDVSFHETLCTPAQTVGLSRLISPNRTVAGHGMAWHGMAGLPCAAATPCCEYLYPRALRDHVVR